MVHGVVNKAMNIFRPRETILYGDRMRSQDVLPNNHFPV
jgi:hypothetical protein